MLIMTKSIVFKSMIEKYVVHCSLLASFLLKDWCKICRLLNEIIVSILRRHNTDKIEHAPKRHKSGIQYSACSSMEFTIADFF